MSSSSLGGAWANRFSTTSRFCFTGTTGLGTTRVGRTRGGGCGRRWGRRVRFDAHDLDGHGRGLVRASTVAVPEHRGTRKASQMRAEGGDDSPREEPVGHG
jgi:hypothetical protein